MSGRKHLASLKGIGLFLLAFLSPLSTASAQRTSFRDSAGIAIVEHGRLDAPQWRIGSTAVVEIGSITGPPHEQFEIIHQATYRPGDRITVVDGGAREVRMFDERGDHLGTFGRDGEGPGEFGAVTRGWWLSTNELVTWDPRLKRVSVFDSAAEVKGTLDLRSYDPLATPVTALSSGAILVRTDVFGVSPNVEGDGNYISMAVIDREGHLVSMLPRQPLGEFWFQDGKITQKLFTLFTQIAADQDGYWVGTTFVDEIRRYNHVGELQRIVRWSGSRRAPSRADIEKVVEQLSEIMHPSVLRSTQEEFRRRPLAENFASHGALLVDQARRLWVQDYQWPGMNVPSRGSPWWTVFSPAGLLLGRVQLPAGHQLADAGEGWILMVGYDELDVPYVRLHDLGAPSGYKR